MPFKLTFIFFFSFTILSQNNNDTIKKELKEITLQSLRYGNAKSKISQQLHAIGLKEIEFQNAQSTADLLANTGKLTIQKSQQGGGSPIIRGFEANRILILVDGVRMNNLIFRSGHLQNILSLDDNQIEKIDVLYGPSSTLFGSDALGGAVHIQTKNPKNLIENNKKKFSGLISNRFATVNNEKAIAADFNFASKKWGSLSSFSYNYYSDLKMGKSKNGKNDYFGERNNIVITLNGTDYVVPNNNKYLQLFSGYEQFNFLQKIKYQPKNNIEHLVNFQYSNTTNIPRYDRLTDVNSNNQLRTARWDYGPQKRLYSGYTFTKLNTFWNSDIKFGIHYQNYEESRITRAYNNKNETTRLEKVNALSTHFDVKKRFSKGDLIFGIESFYDNLNSSALLKNKQTNFIEKASTRYPDGKNFTFKTEIFANYTHILNENTTYNLGARIGYNKLESNINTNSFFNFPFSTIKQKNFTYSANAGITNFYTKNIKLGFNISSGFRVPNVDDVGKIFDSAPGILIVPNPNLKPEKTITADFNFTYFKKSDFEFENILFITRMYDAVVTDNYLFNNKNEIIYEGKLSEVFANQNLGKAFIFGYATQFNYKFLNNFNFLGTFNYTHGRLETNSEKKPLDHIAPIHGKISVNFSNKWINFDVYMLYNGKKHIEDYLLNAEDNEQYAPKNGMPGWQTYNCKMALKTSKNFTVYSGIENIFDTQYRTFASGINAPGKNIYLGAKYQM